MNILNPLYLRRSSPTQIKYILISAEENAFSLILSPDEFNNYAIEFIQRCPRDLMQMVNPIHFYELCMRYANNNSFHFSLIYAKNIETHREDFTYLKDVRLFFIDAGSSRVERTVEFLKLLHRSTHFYFVFNNKQKIEIEIDNKVDSPATFIWALLSNQDKILSELGMHGVQLAPFVNSSNKDLISFHTFGATQGNYWMINNLIGNYDMGTKDLADDKEDSEINKASEDSQEAMTKGDSFERQLLFIEQVNKLDFFLNLGLTEGIFKPTHPTEPFLSPLLLIAPYINPDIKQKYAVNNPEVQGFLKASSVEQTRNYTGAPTIELKGIDLMRALYNQKLTTLYLDNVAFLHASYDYSPVIRLPLKGASINRELSFFRTETFYALRNIKARKSLVKNMERFGSVYKHKCIAPEIENLINERNGQIVLMSDIPLEWLTFGEVPLAFSHDICRLPIAGYGGLMANYVSNLVTEYRVETDILKRTLVIFGSSEPAFRIWQDECVEMSKQKGFDTVRCSSIMEVAAAIRKYRPEFLIFDCHGGYDSKTSSTYLLIGDERLTGEAIVQNNISAQLVFLSACGTAPTYGSINTVGNAFMGMGALAVTTTYLPVEINRSSILYLRVLNKLDIAAQKGLHKNWLEFICHLVRTEYIMSRLHVALSKSSSDVGELLRRQTTRLLTKSLLFNNRKKLYKDIDIKLSSIVGRGPKIFENIVPEYLFYSHLGRADLIHFSKWLEKYRALNEMEVNSGQTTS